MYAFVSTRKKVSYSSLHNSPRGWQKGMCMFIPIMNITNMLRRPNASVGDVCIS